MGIPIIIADAPEQNHVQNGKVLVGKSDWGLKSVTNINKFIHNAMPEAKPQPAPPMAG